GRERPGPRRQRGAGEHHDQAQHLRFGCGVDAHQHAVEAVQAHGGDDAQQQPSADQHGRDDLDDRHRPSSAGSSGHRGRPSSPKLAAAGSGGPSGSGSPGWSGSSTGSSSPQGSSSGAGSKTFSGPSSGVEPETGSAWIASCGAVSVGGSSPRRPRKPRPGSSRATKRAKVTVPMKASPVSPSIA